MPKTVTDLFAFGNRSGPRPPRIGVDVLADENGRIVPNRSPLAPGASLFGDPKRSGLTGHYHRLPAGTEWPEGIEITADGKDVLPESPFAETHHTFHAVEWITLAAYVESFLKLPWEYGGRQ